jgi:3-deoxy-D-manno-octulosonic acid kinase
MNTPAPSTGFTGLPEGYDAVHHGRVRGFAVAAGVPWLRGVLADGSTLHAWGSRQPSGASLAGRGRVYSVAAPVEGPDRHPRWAVRHYYRGGAVAAPLLGDRYLAAGVPRPLRELMAAHHARARGIPTPAVVAGAVYPAGLWYRADLVTEQVPDASDLAEVLWNEEASSFSAEDALFSVGALVRRLERAGILHPDLNAKNLVLTGSGDAPHVHLVDLDGCCARDPGVPVPTFSMRRRLERSLRKFEDRTGRRLPTSAWTALRAGFSERAGRPA